VLTHIVLFRLVDPASDADQLVAALRVLPGRIPEIRGYEVGVDVSRGPNSYDVGLYSTFDDAEALERYRAHPAHQEVLELVERVSSNRVVVDWESP
jgi:hypothetical protein